MSNCACGKKIGRFDGKLCGDCRDKEWREKHKLCPDGHDHVLEVDVDFYNDCGTVYMSKKLWCKRPCCDYFEIRKVWERP